MELLEREQALTDLRSSLEAAVSGVGMVALLSGEAGIGKTTLIRAFAKEIPDTARLLAGACDDLAVPRPLGPFLEIADQVPGLARRLEDRRLAAPAAVLEELRAGPPTVCVIEDAHWADEATIDVLTHVARRVRDVNLLLVVSFRDDELGSDHPLRRALAAVPSGHARRVELRGLSLDAARRLAGGEDDVELLHAATGGNPFFLTEVLTAGGGRTPASVRDAVLARLARLPDASRSVAELVSVVPGRAELWLLEEVRGPVGAALGHAERGGLLIIDSATARFRHELARRAVEESLSGAARVDLNRAVLSALTGRGVASARLAHHAWQVDDADALLRHGLAAADEAAARHSHREASEWLARTLQHAGRMGIEERAAALEKLSAESFHAGQAERSIRARDEELALRRGLGEPHATSRSLQSQAQIRWWMRDRPGAEIAAAEAVSLVERLPPSRELAMGLSVRSRLAMLKHHSDEALEWGRRAMEIARALGDVETLVHAQVNVGTATAMTGAIEDGHVLLEEAVAVAREHGIDHEVCRALVNLAWTALDLRRYDIAREGVGRGMHYALDRGLESYERYLIVAGALVDVATGAWNAAAEAVEPLVGQTDSARSVDRIPALEVAGLIAARTGRGDAARVLDEAWRLAQETDELQRIQPVAAARAELAWLRGDAQGVDDATRAAFALALEVGDRNGWDLGELALWRFRAGLLDAPPEPCAPPYELEMRGDVTGAAACWEAIGAPYSRALALLGSPDPACLIEAIATLDALGAVPVAALARDRLRRMGVATVPRGPRSSTRTNPAGLTHRQLNVLELIVEGHSNPEIARRLVLSPKTVEHHVAAVLAKLEATSRQEAATKARELGVIPGS